MLTKDFINRARTLKQKWVWGSDMSIDLFVGALIPAWRRSENVLRDFSARRVFVVRCDGL